MFDTWLEALENEETSAVIMIDLSAAFDVVDHNILINKLELYGLEEGTVYGSTAIYLADLSKYS